MEQHRTAAANVAIASLWFGLNYGSILTAWALYDTVEQLGYQPVLLHKPAALWEPRYNAPDSVAGKFIHAHCRTAGSVSDDEEWRQLAAGFPTVLVGSDALWRYEVCGRQTGLLYLLDFLPDEAKRLAYGVTMGRALSCPAELLSAWSRALHRFDAISVKELAEVLVLANSFDLPAELVLDPIFLPEKSRYLALAEQAVAPKDDPEPRFVFSYIEGIDDRKRRMAVRASEVHHASLRCHVNLDRFPEAKEELGLPVAYHIMTEDWLYYMSHAEFIVTDSYHGMCMALLLEKPFIVLAHEDFPDLYRFRGVLDPLGLCERLLILEEDLHLREYLFRKPVRYSLVTPKLNKLREASLNWLRGQLAGKKEVQA